MNKKRSGCQNLLPKEQYLQCMTCKAAYDLECANVSHIFFVQMQRKEHWKCPECHSKRPKVGNINTPVRNTTTVTTGDPSPSYDESNVTLRSRRGKAASPLTSDQDGPTTKIDTCTDDLQRLQSSIVAELKFYMNQLIDGQTQAIREAIANLTMAVNAQNTRIEDLEARIYALENKAESQQRGDVSVLEDTIAQLQAEILDKDQETLTNDVEIAGCPEAANENCTHLVLSIATKIGVELDERDVVSAERAGPPRTTGVEGGAPRPRPLVVRLTRRAPRDQLLRAARVRRGLDSTGLPLPAASAASSPLYINERLTRHNRQLFQKARKLAVNYDYKFVWTRDGKVFVRRAHGTTRYRLRSEEDLLRVFVKNCLHLQLYREPGHFLKGQSKASLSFQQFLGFESGFTLDKESHTIAVICQDVLVVLAFETREKLIAWQVKVSHQLGPSQQFVVLVGSSRRLQAGPARMHLRHARVAITSGVPPKILHVWDLHQLRRYGVVEGRFCLEGGSQCGKGEGLHTLISDQAQEISDAFDDAVRGNFKQRSGTAASRKSAGAEMNNKMRPATRLSDFNAVDQSIPDSASGLYEENFLGEDCGEVSPYWPSDDRRFDDNDFRTSDIEIGAKPPWNDADHITLERCNNCLSKLGGTTRSSTIALSPTSHFNPAWTMEAVPENNSDSSSNNAEYLTPRMIRKTLARHCTEKPPQRPPKPGHLEQKKPPLPLPAQKYTCSGGDIDLANPKVGPYENYDIPKTTHVDQVKNGEYYDTPKRIKQALADDLFQVTKTPTPGALVLAKNCGCILKFASKKKPLIVECEENLQPVECPCLKVTNWANNLISLPYCKRGARSDKVNTEILTNKKNEEMAIYATVDITRKSNRQSSSVSEKDNISEYKDTVHTNYQNLEPSIPQEHEGPFSNYENLEFALSLEYYENAKDLLKKAGVTQSELDALSANLDKVGQVRPKRPRACTKCDHSQTQHTETRKVKGDEYLVMEPSRDMQTEKCRTLGPNPGYTPMSPNPNWSQSLKHPIQKIHKVEIEKSLSIPTLNGTSCQAQSFDVPIVSNRESLQKRSSSVDSARLLEDLKEYDISIGSHGTSSSLETLRNMAVENRCSSSSENDKECYDCCKSSGSENKTSESSSKDVPNLRNKHMDNAQIKRSSSVPCKGGNRDSSSSNDSGVSSCSMKHGGEFQELEFPLTSGQSRSQYLASRRIRGNLSCLHSSLPRKSKSSDPLRDQPMSLHIYVAAKSSSAEAEVPVLPPKQFKGVPESRSTSSGTSDLSDYIETLSITSSQSSSDSPHTTSLHKENHAEHMPIRMATAEAETRIRPKIKD